MPDSPTAPRHDSIIKLHGWQLLALSPGLLWTAVWLALAIDASWNNDQADPAFSIVRCLLVALPLAFYFQRLWNRRVWVRRYLLVMIAICYLLMLLSVLSLGGWASVAAVVIAIAFLHLAHWTDDAAFAPASSPSSFAGDSTMTAEQAMAAAETGSDVPVESETPCKSDFYDRELLDDLDGESEEQSATEECEAADWIQQMTRRTVETETGEDPLEQIEWFGRHQWQTGQTQVELHVLFQPPFLTEPEIQCEVIEGMGRVKVSKVFPHGVRLELKGDHQVLKTSPQTSSLVWLSAVGGMPPSED